MEVLFTPDATAAEVSELYPGASIEPLRDEPVHEANRAEATALAHQTFAEARKSSP